MDEMLYVLTKKVVWACVPVCFCFIGFSLLLRERTLVATGPVEMCVNKLRSGNRSSTKFCRLDDEILPGVGRKSLLLNGAYFLSCLQTVLLSASYDNQ